MRHHTAREMLADTAAQVITIDAVQGEVIGSRPPLAALH
jgi:hypothetical protein